MKEIAFIVNYLTSIYREDITSFFPLGNQEHKVFQNDVSGLVEQTQNYDLLTLDYDTLELVHVSYKSRVQQIQAAGFTGRIIGTTTMNQIETSMRYRDLNLAIQWLYKPFSFDDLDKAINKI